MIDIKIWQENLKAEEQRIRKWATDNNRRIDDEKIKFMARENNGPPPINEWRN